MNKKISNEKALAKIKLRINLFYEKLGRQDIEDTEEERQELIEDIDEILNKTDISTKELILGQLKIDNDLLNKIRGK